MRRILSLVLVLSLIFSFATAVSAEDTPTSGQFSDTVSWSLADGVLTISGTGPVDSPIMYNYPWQKFPDKFHKVIVEEGITSIGYCCFVLCRNLEEVVLPESLEVIGRQALSQTKIKELRIPKNVHTIGEGKDAFAQILIGNDYLENIFVDDANTHYYDIDGILFCRDTSVLVCCPSQKELDTYTVPAGIKGIASSAFARSKATSIILPQGLELIGPAAFIYSELPSIEIPDTVTKIGNSAFMTNKNLKQITLPASVSMVEDGAFTFCEQLESVTILNPNCSIFSENELFPRRAALVGYKNSTTHEFAKMFGYLFKDVETGESINYYREGGLADLLPEDLSPSHPVFCIISSHVGSTGVRTGYQPSVPIITDTSHPTYQDIYNTTLEITKNCATDAEKAKAVMDWLVKNVKYVNSVGTGSFTIETVYSMWEQKPLQGNCMFFTRLNNFMLSLLKIPTASVSNITHSWTMALLDGKWVLIDSTNGQFGSSSYAERATNVFFCVGDVVCVIDDFSGIKVTSYGTEISDTKTTNDIYIPDYVTHIYESTFRSRKYAEGQEKVTVRGEKGSYAETYVRENFKDYDITYEGTRFVAKPHVHTPGSYQGSIYEHWQVCSSCNATLGYYNHNFDNCSDTVCDACGYTRSASHDFFGDWLSDDSGHWQQCSNYNCTATSPVEAHSWDKGAAEGNIIRYTCAVCKRQKTETVAEPTQPTTPAPTQPPASVPTQPPITEPTQPSATAPTQTVPENTTVSTTPPAETMPTTAPNNTATPSQTPTEPTEAPAPDGESSILLWICLTVVVLGGGAVATILLLKRRNRK